MDSRTKPGAATRCEVCRSTGVQAGPVKAIAEMADDVQVLANDLLVELDHRVATSRFL